jgi:hypothetical protein
MSVILPAQCRPLEAPFRYCNIKRWPMSLLGQFRPISATYAMSAAPPTTTKRATGIAAKSPIRSPHSGSIEVSAERRDRELSLERFRLANHDTHSRVTAAISNRVRSCTLDIAPGLPLLRAAVPESPLCKQIGLAPNRLLTLRASPSAE